MSLRIKKNFGRRSDDDIILSPKKKYIFAFEGDKTEKQYFEAINDNKEELEISDLIEIKVLEREDASRSNQLQVVKDVEYHFNTIFSCKDSKEDIKEHLKLILDKNDFDFELKVHIIELIDNIFCDENYSCNIDKFIYELNQLLNKNDSINYFIQSINNFKEILDFDEDFDVVCIIIDRDKNSFTDSQYDKVIEICYKYDYRLGVTNPCFEFWLLLHFNDCREYSCIDIKENLRETTNGKNFIEKCLIKEINSYNKSRLNFNVFKDKISNAIENEKIYCEDINLLKDKIGSSVGKIISEILN